MNPQQMQQQGPSQSQTPTEDLTKAFTVALQNALPAIQPQQQQQQMSPEEMDRYLGTYRPDMSVIHALFGADPERDQGRLEAFMDIVQRIVANATAHANILSQTHLQDFGSQHRDTFDDVKHLSQERFFGSIFDKDNEDLKPFEQIIRGQLPQFEKMPDYPRDRSQRPTFVRNKAIDLIKTFNPTFRQQQQQQQGNAHVYANSPRQQDSPGQTRQPQLNSQLPNLNGGGQGAASQAAPGSSNDMTKVMGF